LFLKFGAKVQKIFDICKRRYKKYLIYARGGTKKIADAMPAIF